MAFGHVIYHIRHDSLDLYFTSVKHFEEDYQVTLPIEARGHQSVDDHRLLDHSLLGYPFLEYPVVAPYVVKNGVTGSPGPDYKSYILADRFCRVLRSDILLPRSQVCPALQAAALHEEIRKWGT